MEQLHWYEWQLKEITKGIEEGIFHYPCDPRWTIEDAKKHLARVKMKLNQLKQRETNGNTNPK